MVNPAPRLQPFRSPLAKVAGVALVSSAVLRFGWSWPLPAYGVLFLVLLALAVIDLEHYIIPNRIIGPATVAGLGLVALAAIGEGEPDAFVGAFLAGAGAFTVMLGINLISPAGMGMGDVKLSFLLGLHLGLLGVGELVLGFFLAFLSSALVGLALVATRRRGRKDAVPFGPFLALGTVSAVLFGDPILRWYAGA